MLPCKPTVTTISGIDRTLRRISDTPSATSRYQLLHEILHTM